MADQQNDFGFSTFRDLNFLLKGRKIVLFGGGGAGSISDKTRRALNAVKPAFIADNNANMWGTNESGLEVSKPEKLQHGGKGSYFVVICTMSFRDVAEQLKTMGFSPGVDFIVSPVLNDLRIISELETLKAKMLFTSGFPEDSDPRWGGGIYELVLNEREWTHRKLYSGTCYGIVKHGDGYIAVDDVKGIVRLDKNYKVELACEVKPGTRAHGIAYSQKHNQFYVACSNTDDLLVLSENLKPVGTISLCHKFGREGHAAHHCNDICIVGESAYVSMFSLTGNHKRGVFDGGVLEIDLETKEIVGPVIQDLWMPHNVSFHDGNITVLDSLRGELRKYNAQPIGRFPGFSRGLDTDGVFYYVGQSRNRNYSKYLGLSLNISIDASIIVFDERTKVSRSLSLPPQLSEIHSILRIE